MPRFETHLFLYGERRDFFLLVSAIVIPMWKIRSNSKSISVNANHLKYHLFRSYSFTLNMICLKLFPSMLRRANRILFQVTLIRCFSRLPTQFSLGTPNCSGTLAETIFFAAHTRYKEINSRTCHSEVKQNRRKGKNQNLLKEQ